MTRLLVAASLALSTLAAAAPRESPAQLMDRVLGGIEHATTAADVALLGADADHALIAVASDARSSRLRRMRAIVALRHVPSPDARDFLLAVVRELGHAEAGADVLDLAAAATALAPHGRAVLGALLPLVTHRSADVRQAAAAALAQMRLPESRSALTARLVVERDPGVRTAVARALASLDTSPR